MSVEFNVKREQVVAVATMSLIGLLFISSCQAYAPLNANFLEIDPNLGGVSDENGRCIFVWTPAELVGDEQFGDGRGAGIVYTYDKISGLRALPGDYGAKHVYKVRPEDVIPARDFLSFIAEADDGVFLGVPRECQPGNPLDIAKFRYIGPFGNGFALMPPANDGVEENWGRTKNTGMVRYYRTYTPNRP